MTENINQWKCDIRNHWKQRNWYYSKTQLLQIAFKFWQYMPAKQCIFFNTKKITHHPMSTGIGDHASQHLTISSRMYQFMYWYFAMPCWKAGKNVFSLFFSIFFPINLSSQLLTIYSSFLFLILWSHYQDCFFLMFVISCMPWPRLPKLATQLIFSYHM